MNFKSSTRLTMSKSQVVNMYEMVDRICMNAVAISSVYHFLQNYGSYISVDEFKQKRARLRGTVLAQAQAFAELLKSIELMEQPK